MPFYRKNFGYFQNLTQMAKSKLVGLGITFFAIAIFIIIFPIFVVAVLAIAFIVLSILMFYFAWKVSSLESRMKQNQEKSSEWDQQSVGPQRHPKDYDIEI